MNTPLRAVGGNPVFLWDVRGQLARLNIELSTSSFHRRAPHEGTLLQRTRAPRAIPCVLPRTKWPF